MFYSLDSALLLQLHAVRLYIYIYFLNILSIIHYTPRVRNETTSILICSATTTENTCKTVLYQALVTNYSQYRIFTRERER